MDREDPRSLFFDSEYLEEEDEDGQDEIHAETDKAREYTQNMTGWSVSSSYINY